MPHNKNSLKSAFARFVFVGHTPDGATIGGGETPAADAPAASETTGVVAATGPTDAPAATETPPAAAAS